MIGPRRPRLSIVRQCELLPLNRSSAYYRPEPESSFNLTLVRLIDEAFTAPGRWPDTSGDRGIKSAASGFPD